ncbi:MAG: hypothetical protein WBP26_05260 [Candidatus Saccharimonadales bacterium]
MFWKEHARYIVGFLIAIAMAILVFSLIFKAIGGNDSGDKTEDQVQLVDYIETDAVMSMTALGPIVAEQNYQAVRISVDTLQAKIEVMSGFEGNVVSSQVYSSNNAAFNEFVRALAGTGFDRGIDDPRLEDEAGQCPTGVRYIFSVTEDGQTKQRYWTGTCTKGTFEGNRPQTVDLFQAQIPDYGTQVRGVRFGI